MQTLVGWGIYSIGCGDGLLGFVEKGRGSGAQGVEFRVGLAAVCQVGADASLGRCF